MILSPEALSTLDCKSAPHDWRSASPYPHIVIDNFLEKSIAKSIADEFPDYSASFLDGYSNAIEKKLVNHWNKFSPVTYAALLYLCSREFTDILAKLDPSLNSLSPDYGLHGGGLHMHSRGGKLNVHLDYSIHPKALLQRKLNLLVYLTPNWQHDWGGSLGLYGNESEKHPGALFSEIHPVFNRAVIFDVSLNSWHGLPSPIKCPSGVTRNSLAVYY